MMNGKKNCWEAKSCGREAGGTKSHELGVCPASTTLTCNGMNGGKNGGRMCWAVAGTLCGGKVQGEFAQKRMSCMTCEFYTAVKGEEGSNFKMLMEGMRV